MDRGDDPMQPASRQDPIQRETHRQAVDGFRLPSTHMVVTRTTGLM